MARELKSQTSLNAVDSESPAPDFRLMFEASSELCLVLDAALNIVAVTDAFAKATHICRENSVGQNIWKVLGDPSDTSTTGSYNLCLALKEVLAKKSRETLPVQKFALRRPDEMGGGFEERWWSSVNTPLLDDKGNLRYIIHRIDECPKPSAPKSEINGERLDAILSAVSSGLIVTDMQHRIVLMNRVAEKLLGAPEGKSAGLSLDEAIQDAGLRERIRATLGKQETGAKFDFVMPAIGSSTQPLTLCARTALIRDKQRRTTGTLTVIEDVTHEREVDRLKTEFLSTAAHELRTPLTSIRGFSEILLTREMSDEKIKHFLTTINIQATNLGNIINDLLDLARIESGRGLELRRAANDVVAIAREVLDPYMQRSGNHRYVLDTSDKQILAHCDREKLRQALQNLVSNAVKYSPQGGEILVKLERKEPFLTCSVSDHGIGMTPDELSRVFEKFYRANAGTTAAEGTGLGMSIVKAVIEQHGGTIRIDSTYGKGTRATFTLPLGLGSGLMNAVSVTEPGKLVTGARRILVLEDDPAAGAMIEFYLKEAGFNVALASRGAGFVDRACTELPDLICLDAILPDADGFNLCKELKSEPRTKAIPVIFVSVRDSEKDRGLALGASAFVTKPYTAPALLEAVNRAMRKPTGALRM